MLGALGSRGQKAGHSGQTPNDLVVSVTCKTDACAKPPRGVWLRLACRPLWEPRRAESHEERRAQNTPPPPPPPPPLPVPIAAVFAFSGRASTAAHTLLLACTVGSHAYGGLSPDTYQHFEQRANLAREHGDATPNGDSPLLALTQKFAMSLPEMWVRANAPGDLPSFRVYHGRRMSNAIVVADSQPKQAREPHSLSQAERGSRTLTDW